jgi:hypothetical protein
MSKRALKNYLNELTKAQLEEQVLDLYARFKEVKTFYDFTFNPKEDKLIAEAKQKITKEYFPKTRRRPKARRSTAQKYIKHFRQIGVEPSLLADLMLFNIETAQKYNRAKPQKAEAFYKSISNSFIQALGFVQYHGLQNNFHSRLIAIAGEAEQQSWFNAEFLKDRLAEVCNIMNGR